MVNMYLDYLEQDVKCYTPNSALNISFSFYLTRFSLAKYHI